MKNNVALLEEINNLTKRKHETFTKIAILQADKGG
jgi:hypothetical protein